MMQNDKTNITGPPLIARLSLGLICAMAKLA